MSNTASLFFYYFIFSITAFIGGLIESRKNSNVILIKRKNIIINLKFIILITIFLLVPTIIMGIRYGIGTDYMFHNIMYNKSVIGDFAYERYGGYSIEIIPYILARMGNYIFSSFHGYLFILSFLTLSFSFYALKYYSKEKNYSLMIFIFMCICFGPTLNISRQMLAVSIMMTSYKFIHERNFAKYTLGLFVATLCHTSAIACAPMYFLAFDGKFSKIKEVVITILCIILPLFFERLFNYLVNFPIFAKYTTLYLQEFSYTAHYTQVLIRLPIIIVLILFHHKLIKNDKRNRTLYVIYVVEIVSIILGFYMHWAFRLMYYCMISEIVLISQIPKLIKKLNTRRLFLVATIIYYTLYFVIVHFYWMHDGIFPYSSFFN